MERINYEQTDREFYYPGDDLGVTLSENETVFKTWAPYATGVFLKLYWDGNGDSLCEILPLERKDYGVWSVEFFHNLSGYYYTFSYEYGYGKKVETMDIYAKACGTNGRIGYVVDFNDVNPDGWKKTKRVKCKNPCDAVIYECHVRDFTADRSSNVLPEHMGKYLGFTESGTKNGTASTALDHLKELGVTHVQLLPVEDFASVDETGRDGEQYNWGYDPLNYNCLEGSYSTNPHDPECRIREFKQLVMTLHKNNIGVIMDVVYNHTYFTEASAFEKSFPTYYHRIDDSGEFTNGSGCGNETASNHLMMRKFIVDSLKFWATEYKIDGFRFDLMALHDIETINIIRDELNKIDPNILMYGEGWTGGESPLSADRLAYKWNSYQFGRIGLFNDNIRDSIKGGTFNAYDKGYISGDRNAAHTLRRGIAGSVPHPQIKDAQEACWAFEPTQTINYCEAHDNHTLWDKLSISAKNYSEEARISMDKLAAAIIMLSQGVPFLQLGQDFLRSKPRLIGDNELVDEIGIYSSNSYNLPDYTNSIKWSRKEKFNDVFEYYKALIHLRRTTPLLRLSTKEEVASKLVFMDSGNVNLIKYKLEDENDCLIVMMNPYDEDREFSLPNGTFYLRLDCDGKSSRSPVERTGECPALSAVVYKRVNIKKNKAEKK